MEGKRSASCLKFEELLDSWKERGLTDEEFEFLLGHQENCPLDIHSFEAADRESGWPTGTLRNWNGRDPLPPPDPEILARNAEAVAKFIKLIFCDDELRETK